MLCVPGRDSNPHSRFGEEGFKFEKAVPGGVVEYRAVPLSWDDDYPFVRRVRGREVDSGESSDTDVTSLDSSTSPPTTPSVRFSSE